jgi:cell division protein FtsL
MMRERLAGHHEGFRFMRSLHAGLLVMQGAPIILGAILAVWIAYYVRVAVTELRAVRQNLEKLNYYFETSPDDHAAPTSSSREAVATAIVAEARAK